MIRLCKKYYDLFGGRVPGWEGYFYDFSEKYKAEYRVVLDPIKITKVVVDEPDLYGVEIELK